MRGLVGTLGLLGSAFSPLAVILVFVVNPFPELWQNVVVAVVLALPLLFLPLTLWAVRSVGPSPLALTKVRRKDADNLSLISSFILPLTVAFFAPDGVRTPASVVVLLYLVVVYWRGGLQYLNPVLMVAGYRLYAVDQANGAEVFLLARRAYLPQRARVSAYKYSDNIYLYKETLDVPADEA